MTQFEKKEVYKYHRRDDMIKADDTVPVFTAKETILLIKEAISFTSKRPDLILKFLTVFDGEGTVAKGNGCSITFNFGS